MYKQSLEDPDTFWGTAARSTLKWFKDFDRVSQGGFEQGDVAWFTGGQLNACYNCIDQHLPQRAKQVCGILHISLYECFQACDMLMFLPHACAVQTGMLLVIVSFDTVCTSICRSRQGPLGQEWKSRALRLQQKAFVCNDSLAAAEFTFFQFQIATTRQHDH